MIEGLVMVGMASGLSAYLWWPVAILGSVAAGTAIAHLLLKHADKVLLVFIGFSLFWLASRPDEVTETVRAMGGALVSSFWTVVAFGTWLAR